MFYSWSFVLLLLFAAVIAGFFGALLGVGGGIFIVPVMVLMFHLPMKIAVAEVLYPSLPPPTPEAHPTSINTSPICAWECSLKLPPRLARFQGAFWLSI